MKTKILATNDIHQMNSKWKELVKECQKDEYNIIAIAGDLFPKDKSITGQLQFMKHFVKYINQIKDTGAEIILTLGNDDNQLLVPEMEKLEKDGLIYYAHEKIFEINGYEFAGMPYVPDYPFGYKYWCHAEYNDELRIDPQQYMNPVVIEEAHNRFKNIPNYEEYLKGKISIYDSLKNMADKMEDVSKSIWLIHAPPAHLGLDICAHGAKVGSGAVYHFIEEYQPMITIHGHIHESPEYNGHKWKQNLNKTVCIQGGQLDFDLHYSTIELEDGEIKSITNSVYR